MANGYILERWGMDINKKGKILGGMNLLPNFKKRAGAWQDLDFLEGVTFLRRVCNFYKKNKLKSEIFTGKKSL